MSRSGIVSALDNERRLLSVWKEMFVMAVTRRLDHRVTDMLINIQLPPDLALYYVDSV